jgi:hypothetical protein
VLRMPEVITYSNRGVDLLVRAIRGADDGDELGRLRRSCGSSTRGTPWRSAT